MSKEETTEWQEFVKLANQGYSKGLLLVTQTDTSRPNAMTIGWGLTGILWRRPVFMVAVRHSRHTHNLLEQNDEFTVNIPSDGMDKVLDYCGTTSGRSKDKFKDLGLKTTPGRRTKVPIILGCKGYFECRVVGKLEVAKDNVKPDVIATAYPSGDFHTLYFGEILAAYGPEKT